MKVSTKFADRIPTDMIGNLKWRAKVHRRVMEDPTYAAVIRDACAVDPVFYTNGFLYTYDPRCQPFAKIPMVLYPQFQTGALLEILRCIGKEDLLIEKSRDMGASWLCAIAVEWLWHFRRRLSFLFGSRSEQYVDSAENPKSLFWKLDFIHDNLPSWLMPAGYNRSAHRRKMHMSNPETGSVIDGESTNKEFARGDRRTAIILDEFAAVDTGQRVLDSTLPVTKSRIFNSTPLGFNNAYYDLTLTNIKKLTLHWSDHPEKRKGLYTTDKRGELKILDPYNYPEGYKPILDGELRSIAFDFDWHRSSPRTMASEWNIDYGGSGHQFFDADVLRTAMQRTVRPPLMLGELDFDIVTCEPTKFLDSEEGRLHLWHLISKDGKPSLDQPIVIGCDISAGTGSSNSVAVGWNVVTHEKVFEYAHAFLRPEEFAARVVALCRWYNKPLLIWESNGPGLQFGAKIIELKYFNVYYRRREESISKKSTDVPGWASTKDSKRKLLGRYKDAVESASCANRSRMALEECREYVFEPNGGVAHARESNRTDPTGAKSNHGDRVIADALAWFMVSEKKPKHKLSKQDVPIGSLAWRRQQYAANSKENYGKELVKHDGW